MEKRALMALAAMLILHLVTMADDEDIAPIIGFLLSGERAPAASLSVGQNHNCAVLEDGKIVCWG